MRHVNYVTLPYICLVFFFFNDTATTEIYTLSLHDALPISPRRREDPDDQARRRASQGGAASAEGGRAAGEFEGDRRGAGARRSEEHTSELQSPCNLVCRLLLEKTKRTICTFMLETQTLRIG